MTGTEALLAVAGSLEEAAIPYMIVGAFSSNFYGIPRSTQDGDMVLHLDETAWAKLPELLPQDIRLDPQSGFEMVTSTRKELLRVQGSLFEIELFHLTDDPHDQSRFSRRVKIEIGAGGRVWLPTAEDVVIQKLRWFRQVKRSKDREDVLGVVQVQEGNLDWNYLRIWCDRHGTGELLEALRKEAESVEE